MKRRRESAYFTMIELLVVIAVITILTSLLLPALGSAKGLAKKIQCLGNLKQIGIGTISYTGDYNGWIWCLGYSPSAVDNWAQCLQGGNAFKHDAYVSSKNSFCCPSSSVPRYADPWSVYGFYQGRHDGDYASKGFTFMFNASAACVFYSLGNIPQPSGFALAGDTVTTTTGGPSSELVPSLASAGNVWVYLQHKGFANLAYADGHAEADAPSALKQSSSGFKAYVDKNLQLKTL